MGAAGSSFLFTSAHFINNWKNRAVGQQKDRVIEARVGSVETQNVAQSQELHLQTSLLYEIRSETRARFDTLENKVSRLEERMSALEARKS